MLNMWVQKKKQRAWEKKKLRQEEMLHKMGTEEKSRGAGRKATATRRNISHKGYR